MSIPERMPRQEAQRPRIRMYEVLDGIWATHPGFRAVDKSQSRLHLRLELGRDRYGKAPCKPLRRQKQH